MCQCIMRAQSTDIVQLTLGSHQLEGKVVPLTKPLALLDFAGGSGDTDGTGQRCEVGGVANASDARSMAPK